MFKKCLMTLSLLIGCGGAYGKPQQVIPPIEDAAREAFYLQQLDLTFNQHRYRLFIGIPKTPPPAGGFPVLYMLDGNGQFPLALNQYQPQQGHAPLIVAIGYQSDKAYLVTDRTRDYTIAAPGEEFAKGGGAAQFYQFISRQVKPLVNELYPVNNAKTTLAGHSFGGLFTLYVLFNHPEAFQRYVAASPSIWWGESRVIPTRSPLLTARPERVILTTGEYEEKPDAARQGAAVDAARQATINKRQQAIKVRTLADRLQREGADVQFIMFPGKNHGSVIPDALRQAVLVAGQ